MASRISVAAVMEFIVRLEDDPARRVLLDGAPSSLFLAAVELGLVGETDMPEFARVIGECVKQGLLAYSREMAASHLPSPEQPWTDYAFQMRSGYHSTVSGQQLVELVDRRRARAVKPGRDEHADSDGEEADSGRYALRAPTDWWLSQIAYACPVPSPEEFGPLVGAPSENDMRVLRRYVAEASELSRSLVLRDQTIGYRVSLMAQTVETTMPSAELLRGLAVGFRQTHSAEENASFASVMRILQTALRGQRGPETDGQLAQLASWGTAVRKLRAHWLSALVSARANEEGITGSLYPPVPEQTPEQVLSAYFYGDHIHWDRHAAEVESRSEEPLEDARYRYFFLIAILQLTAVYIPFSAVVVAAAPTLHTA
jgi:hypothetical protein